MPQNIPPIIELAIGVQFVTERSVDSSKIILFWDKFLRTSNPIVVEAPTLEDHFEKFDEENRRQQSAFFLRLESVPAIRYQFTNQARDRMAQLQSTRLIINWMRGNSDYPRFSQIHEDFSETYEHWSHFANSADIGEVIPNQWELTYINFLPQGELWETPKDWHKISPLFTSGLDAFEPLDLDDRSFQWRLRMPNNIGRITLRVVQGNDSDGQQGLHLTISARGPASSITEVHNRMKIGHDEILKLFSRLATSLAKEYWSLQS